MSDLMKFLVVGNQSFEVCDAAARAGIGSPLRAETVAEMTDTDKVYVYVGDETGYENGHWYYYDGSDWQDGGIYNSAAIQLDTTLSIAGEAADAKAVGDALALKANIDGEYESMTVGNAEQLVATVGENNKTPYNFRASGGSIDIGDREVDRLVGGTVAWNQLVQNGNFANNDNWFASNATLSVSNNVGTITFTDQTGYVRNIIPMISGHKYIRMLDIKGVSGVTYTLNGEFESHNGTGNWQTLSNVYNAISTSDHFLVIKSQETSDFQPFYVRNVMYFDLTAMFGPTIADYIYSLESGTTGAGVAFFKKLFPDTYYAYNAGELMSVKTSAHVMTGFNQWDGDYTPNTWIKESTGETEAHSGYNVTDYIRILPNTIYYKAVTGTSRATYFDYDKNAISGGIPSEAGTITTPNNAYYVRFSIADAYISQFIINLHWDGERDGEYEAYKKYSYALDSDLELRGLFKLDASNNLYCDGDTYESDGTVTRNYEYRAYASGDESLPDTITDGTHTVTKLTTPTTETADPYQNPQIVDDWGTEEYVDSRTVAIPVGHDTLYQANLRAKIEMMPNLPEVNGDYVLRQSASGAEYVAHTSPIPTLPSEDGTYVLKCTVASGTATLSWEVQS